MLLKIRWYIPFFIKRFINWVLLKFKFKKTNINHTNFFQLWDILNKKIFIWDYTHIGSHWYFFARDNRIYIWKFCSIAENVYIITYNHPTKYISWHINQFNNKITLNQEIKHWDVIIWNDVRIWHNCTILSWVKIWNWAIVWAWSVVTKDIPPYAIVWWNPAKIIKYRFSEDTIKYIEDLKRRDWSEKKIKENEYLFNKKFS